MGWGGKRAQPGPWRRGQPQGTAPGVPMSPPSVPPRGEAPQGKEPTSPAGAGLCSRVRRAQPGTWLCRDSDGDRPVLTPTAAFPSIPLAPGYRFGKLGGPKEPPDPPCGAGARPDSEQGRARPHGERGRGLARARPRFQGSARRGKEPSTRAASPGEVRVGQPPPSLPVAPPGRSGRVVLLRACRTAR